MTAETELKLRITPAGMAQLKRHSMLAQYQQAKAVSRHVYSIYYDTPKLELIQSGYALRLRKQGRNWLQTIKGGGRIVNGLHQREEYDVLLRAPELDLDMLQSIDHVKLISRKRAEKLKPVFVTDFKRNSRLLDWHGAEIEVCLDEGALLTEHEQIPLCEIELELKKGDPALLYDLAQAILNIVPVELENISKAEQGYRLYAGKSLQPVRADHMRLGKHATLSQSLKQLLASCIDQFQGNLPGIKGEDSAEFIHQMRIALRRLRLVLRMISVVSEDAAMPDFQTQTAEIAKQLGVIREWDVFITQTLQPLREHMPHDEGLKALEQTSRELRNQRYIEFLQPENLRLLQQMLLQFGAWMQGNYWRRFEFQSISLQDYAVAQIRVLTGDWQAARATIDLEDMAQLHKFRIKGKRLRYGLDFFHTVHGSHEHRKLRHLLEKMQDELGKVHDISIALQLLEQLEAAKETTSSLQAISVAKGWLEHELSVVITRLPLVLREA